MLERATACFESAGRRLFRDSHDAIRSQRSLCRNFWKYNATADDVPNWFIALVQQSNQRPSSALNLSSRNQPQSNLDGGTPFLDFLYPTSPPSELRVSRQSRRLGLRRRKRSFVGFPRNYTSEAVSTTTQPTLPDGLRAHGTPSEGDADAPANMATAELARILESEEKDFDKAWVLYLAAGKPPAFRSPLCQYLISSKTLSDYDRAWQVFEEIPPEGRSPSDFYFVSRSQIRQENSARLIEIAKAATTQEAAIHCLPWIFAYFWNRELWDSAVEVWEIATSIKQLDDMMTSQFFLFSRLRSTSLIWKGLYFGRYLQDSPENVTKSSFALAEHFMDSISKSPTQPDHAPLDVLLEVLRVYARLHGMRDIPHYFRIIDTLQSSSTCSGFSRTIIFYRQLRSRMRENYIMPYRLLERQLASMNSWNMASGIQYFLAEIEHYHKRPGMAAYLECLDCLADAGEVSQVEAVFNKMREDHGIPSDCRPALPLLSVHATKGDVVRTRQQFRRLKEEFNLQPNIYCWNMLLKAHAARMDWNGAQKTFVELLNSGLKPDSHTFGTLMGITANRGDIDATRQLLREARQHEVPITMPMLDTIVQVYCKNGQLDFAEQLAEACSNIQTKISPIRIWNMILVQYARRLDIKSCYRIRNRMEEIGIQPDAWTYYATMLGLVLAGRPHRARKMLREMHKKRRMYAQQEHYSLILFGYVQENNRDMVHIIFREILHRFGKPEPRSSLLFLKSQVQRDLQIAKEAGITNAADIHLKHAEKALTESLSNSHTGSLNFGPSDQHRENDYHGNNEAAVLQYGYLIKEYGSRGAIERARALYQRFLDSEDKLDHESRKVPIEVLTPMMSAHLHAGEYQEVRELWKLALSNAMEQASIADLDFLPASRPQSSEGSQAAQSRTSDPHSANATVSQKDHKVILRAQRFIIAKPLSLYMRALSYQNETNKIDKVVAELEKLGFALTTFNWSNWIQMLAASDNYVDQLKAFRMFEEKFAPRFPGWYKLLRGYGERSPEMTNSTWLLEDPRSESFRDVVGKKGRKYWINIEPDRLQPTYLTVVFLAASLNRVRDRTITQGNVELQMINATAPKTVKLIGEMPYKRDKFQGVLLRHRSQEVDKAKSPTELLYTPGGVLGKDRRIKYRPPIFKDDETLETYQLKPPKDLFEETDEQSLTEVTNDTFELEDPSFEPQPNPMSPADQIDTETHILHSSHKQKKQRNRQFAKVIDREKKRRDVTKQHLKRPNKQDQVPVLASEESFTEEQQVVTEEPAVEETPVIEESEHQEKSEVEDSPKEEESRPEVESVERPEVTEEEHREIPVPDGDKTRE